MAELMFVGAKGYGVVVRSDEEGRFLFRPEEPGVYQLATITASGHLPYAPELGHSPLTVVITGGRRLRGVALYLNPDIQYAGKVTAPNGSPVAGATIEVLTSGAAEQALLSAARNYVADANGEFLFRASNDAVLQARHKDFAPSRARLDFSAQVSHRLVIKLSAPGSVAPTQRLAGRVRDQAGTPVEGARVVATFDAEVLDTAIHPTAETTTDVHGRFSMNSVDPGRYRVTAVAEGKTAQLESVSSGAQDLELVLSVGARLRGTVKDADTGDPIAAFSVHVWRRPDSLALDRVGGRAIVDPSGHYEIAGLPEGTLHVSVTAAGYAESAEQSVEGAAGPDRAPAVADFVLTRGVSLRGTVVDRKSRIGIEATRVRVEMRNARGSLGTVQPDYGIAVTDPAGNFELTGLSPGALSLRVAAPSHHGRIVTGINVPQDASPQPVMIELTPTKPGEEPQLELAGIGIAMHPRADGLVVEEVFAGGAAEEAGIRIGFEVLAVDEIPVKKLGYMGTVRAIRGPEGTRVALTLRLLDGQVGVMVIRRRIIRV
jgi:protocatechuate 3,4-dioxygenase beta subunit